MTQPDSVAIVSGGMDSTTMIYMMMDDGYLPLCLSFDYGQRHKKELRYARATAEKLGLIHHTVDLKSITDLISDQSSLVFGDEVPEGHYAEDNMAKTVVPNRNMMMLSIAGAVATSKKLDAIMTGVHAGDHAQYPDCRGEFILKTEQTLKIGNEGFIPGNFEILTPFIDRSKADIARQAIVSMVPFEETWSCYKGGKNHCGRCGTCVERLEAIHEAAVDFEDGADMFNIPDHVYRSYDKTVYDDTEFWKTAVKEYKEAQHA